MLTSVLKLKNVFADDKLNLLIMRDTPATIQLAERLVVTYLTETEVDALGSVQLLSHFESGGPLC